MNYMRSRKVKSRMIERKTPKSSHLQRNQQLLNSLEMAHPRHQWILSECVEEALNAARTPPSGPPPEEG